MDMDRAFRDFISDHYKTRDLVRMLLMLSFDSQCIQVLPLASQYHNIDIKILGGVAAASILWRISLF